MIRKTFNMARNGLDNLKRNRFAQGVGFLAVSGAAAAQTSGGTSFDVSDSLLAVAAGVAAGLLVSAAMTSARISMKASKLPRQGA